MKHFLTVLTLAGSLALAGCGTQAGANVQSALATAQSDVSTFNAKVKSDVNAAATKVASDTSTALSDVKSAATAVQQFSLRDVTDAFADAEAHQDGTGMTCWSAMKEVVSVKLPEGAATLIQLGRDVIALNIPFKCQNIIPGLQIPALPPGLIPAIP